ncbi:MAG: DUF4416 family protein [Planctomycetes bacterium]|nr:DUF4416 family protein [Planctomycetota bacterium]
MGRFEPPPPVKLFVAALWADAEILEEGLARLAERRGPIDARGQPHPFDLTDYYEREMGRDLRRTLASFRDLIDPAAIVEAKHEAAKIEEDLAGPAGRRVNLDVGYIDFQKAVLASFKAGACKVYLGRGVWADPVARYEKGRFHPFPWSFLDFRDGRYEADLLQIRVLYKMNVNEARE